jgi:hypothetical protein
MDIGRMLGKNEECLSHISSQLLHNTHFCLPMGCAKRMDQCEEVSLREKAGRKYLENVEKKVSVNLIPILSFIHFCFVPKMNQKILVRIFFIELSLATFLFASQTFLC